MCQEHSRVSRCLVPSLPIHSHVPVYRLYGGVTQLYLASCLSICVLCVYLYVCIASRDENWYVLACLGCRLSLLLCDVVQ